MRTRFALIGGGGVLAAFTAVLLAQAPALNVRMGLWEVTSTTAIGGQMPAIDTGKMTPEQKARVEAAMKNLAGGHTNVVKDCLTKEKFEKRSFLTQDRDGRCTQTLTTNTASVLDATATCTGPNASTVHMHFEALSPTSVKGTMNMTSTEDGRTMTGTGTISGKWLGADCGATK